jgi:hypothetical protein
MFTVLYTEHATRLRAEFTCKRRALQFAQLLHDDETAYDVSAWLHSCCLYRNGAAVPTTTAAET